MILYLSPTKILKPNESEPIKKEHFNQKKTNHLLEELKKLSIDELKSFYKASDKIVNNQYEVIHHPVTLGPSGYVYQGEAFRNLNPQSLPQDAIDYLDKHLVIGSALYGYTKLFEPILDHRLDYTKNLNDINLVEYWKEDLQKEFKDTLIINVASQEYAQLLEGLNLVNIHFLDDGKVKSMLAKKARGTFVRECALNNVQTTDEMRKLTILDYTFNPSKSDDTNLYFER